MDLFAAKSTGRQVGRTAHPSVIIFCNRAPVRWLTPPPISSKEIGPKSLQDFGAPNHP